MDAWKIMKDFPAKNVNGFDLACRNSTGNSLGTGYYKSQVSKSIYMIYFGPNIIWQRICGLGDI